MFVNVTNVNVNVVHCPSNQDRRVVTFSLCHSDAFIHFNLHLDISLQVLHLTGADPPPPAPESQAIGLCATAILPTRSPGWCDPISCEDSLRTLIALHHASLRAASIAKPIVTTTFPRPTQLSSIYSGPPCALTRHTFALPYPNPSLNSTDHQDSRIRPEPTTSQP